MKTMLMLGCGFTLAASCALAQAPDVAARWTVEPVIADALTPFPLLVQQETGRSGLDRDRGPRGGRMSQDEDDHPDQGRSDRRPGWLPGGPRDPGMMRPPMAGGMPGSAMMGQGGAHFHMRKGDAAIDAHCPADVRLNECVEAIGRVLDRLGAMGAGSGGPATGPR
jgi:hypothetical protein